MVIEESPRLKARFINSVIPEELLRFLSRDIIIPDLIIPISSTLNFIAPVYMQTTLESEMICLGSWQRRLDCSVSDLSLLSS